MVTKRDLKLGRTIRRLRKKADLTQEKLAEKANLSTTYVGYIEIGHNRPSLKALNRIASALRVKVRDLIPY